MVQSLLSLAWKQLEMLPTILASLWYASEEKEQEFKHTKINDLNELSVSKHEIPKCPYMVF